MRLGDLLRIHAWRPVSGMPPEAGLLKLEWVLRLKTQAELNLVLFLAAARPKRLFGRLGGRCNT